MLHIKILGAGCPNCQRLERETRSALDEATLIYDLTKVTDYGDIASYGVMKTPALVINENVVSSGKIPKQNQIVTWAREHETS
jgi:small redox-active disulfide protein 2